jgi:tetratricopeptide (TPR) repeat protein
MYQQWLNEPKKAEKMFDSALQSARGDLKGSVDIITLMGRLGETDKAMGLLQKILKENPTDEVKKDVAAAYYQINKDSLAMTLYQDVISRNNADGEAVGGLLTVYERMGEFKPALELLNRWLEVHPADSQAQKKREQFQKMTRTG